MARTVTLPILAHSSSNCWWYFLANLMNSCLPTSSPNLSRFWLTRGLILTLEEAHNSGAHGPWRPRGTLSRGGTRHCGGQGRETELEQGGVHCDLPPLPCFCFPGADLQLPTGFTTYKTVRPVSCQIGRGGSPCNTGTRSAETGSPELLVAWRGLTTQGPMGQEARRDIGRREPEEPE